MTPTKRRLATPGLLLAALLSLASGDGFDFRICNITVGSQTFDVVAAQLVWN